LHGIDTGIVSYEYASLDAGVAATIEVASCKGWEIYLGHRQFMSTVVHMTGIIEGNNGAYSTYLRSK